MNRHIGVGDSKNVIVFDPVTYRSRDLAHSLDIAFAFNTGPYIILADNSIYLDRRTVEVA